MYTFLDNKFSIYMKVSNLFHSLLMSSYYIYLSSLFYFLEDLLFKIERVCKLWRRTEEEGENLLKQPLAE